jgi:predicted permease
VAVVLVCFAVGAVVGWRLLRDDHRPADLLDQLVLGVFLPALILRKVPDLPIGRDAAIPIATAWAGLAVSAAAVLVAGRVLRWDRRTVGTLLLVTPLANTSFLGLAAVRALLGGRYVAPAIAYDQLGTFLALTTYGSVIAGRFGVDPAGRAGPSLLQRLLTFPPFLALLVSVPLRWIELPHPALRGLELLGDLVAPVAMLALGLRFRVRAARTVRRAAVACLSIRMLLIPLLALGAAWAAGGGTAWSASVLQAGMPPMATAAVVATTAGLDAELATFVVGAGLLVAFASLPVLGAVLP